MCPDPVGLVNSPVSIPIRVSRHSRASTVPVVMAILGMLVYWPLLSPSVMFFGRRNRVAGVVLVQVSAIGLSAHSWVTMVAGIGTWRRHFPSCMTSGKSTPHGTLLRTKCPLESVTALAMGWPDTWASQAGQLVPAPAAIKSSTAFGIDTMTL